MFIKDYRVVLQPMPGAEPVFAASSYEAADEVARWSDYGTEVVHLVNEWWPGVRRIFFENGPVPGSPEHQWMLERQRSLREQAVADDGQSEGGGNENGYWDWDENGKPFFVPG